MTDRCPSCGATRSETRSDDALVARRVDRDGPGRPCDECRDWLAGRDGSERHPAAAWRKVGFDGLAKARASMEGRNDA